MTSPLQIEVCLSPALLQYYSLEEKIVVVVDILRATTTICVALEHGIEKVIPVASVEECLTHQGENYIHAGERGGEKVKEFPYGNSPFEYMDEGLKGKTLVLTTTNGTRSIQMSRDAYQVVIGAFVNLTPLCDWLRVQNRNILLMCAGWKNKVNLEDSLFAGAVVHHLKDQFEIQSDAALGAEFLYDKSKENLIQVMRQSSHYKRLAGFGIVRDIHYCLESNKVNVIPILDQDVLVPLSRVSESIS